jgi:hypothetical protein
VKNSSPVKKEVVSEKSKSLRKETMLDTIDESNQTPKKHARSAKSNSVEKADKKSPSKKLSSSVVKSEANSMETLGNVKQKSPRKRLKQTPSPERLSVVTPESFSASLSDSFDLEFFGEACFCTLTFLTVPVSSEYNCEV